MHFEIVSIQKAVRNSRHRFTLHALEKLIEKDISPEEVREAMLAGEIIETYPEDKYGPSCLELGKCKNEKILHVHCSVDPVWIITAYCPAQKPNKWDSFFKKRR